MFHNGLCLFYQKIFARLLTFGAYKHKNTFLTFAAYDRRGGVGPPGRRGLRHVRHLQV